MRTKLSIMDVAAQRQAAQDAIPKPDEVKLAAFMEVMNDPSYLKLAASTEEFGYLTEDVVQRGLIGEYQATPNDMLQIFRIRENIPNFNDIKTVPVTGAESRLQRVLESGEYLQVSLSEGDEKSYQVAKWGQIYELSWESFLADSLSVFQNLPRRFATAGARSLGWFATQLLFDANGPRSSVFEATGGQSAISDIPFTLASPAPLETAVSEMLQYTDPAGDPIVADPVYLMVPPALKLAAMAKLRSITLAPVVDSSGSGTGNPMRVETANVVRDLNIKLIVNPWLPIVCSSGTIGQTTWALFTNPNNIPIGEIGFLAGHRYPKVSMRESGQTNTSEFEGSFETDTLGWKVRHVFGGVALDGRAGWASTGQ